MIARQKCCGGVVGSFDCFVFVCGWAVFVCICLGFVFVFGGGTF